MVGSISISTGTGVIVSMADSPSSRSRRLLSQQQAGGGGGGGTGVGSNRHSGSNGNRNNHGSSNRSVPAGSSPGGGRRSTGAGDENDRPSGVGGGRDGGGDDSSSNNNHGSGPPSSRGSSRHGSPGDSMYDSLSSAADIIKSIDMAFAEASTSTITAAREVEEARKNARAASELARKFMSVRNQNKTRNGRNAATSHLLLTSGTGGTSFDNMYTNGGGIGSASPFQSPTSSSYRRSPMNGVAGTPPLSGGGSSGGFFSTSTAAGRRYGRGSSSPDSIHLQQASRNVEDLVKLSLELEKAKSDLEHERMSHDETKSALSSNKAKCVQYERQIERLLNDMETQRESHGRAVDTLEKENAELRMRVDAAEEDAAMALDLAKSNNDSREQVEEVLTQALEQIDDLKHQLSDKNALLAQVHATAQQQHAPPGPPPPPPPMHVPHHHDPTQQPLESALKQPSTESDPISTTAATATTTKVVRFADVHEEAAHTTTPITPTQPTHLPSSDSSSSGGSTTPRALILSGRDLLHRSMTTGGQGGVVSGTPVPSSSSGSSSLSPKTATMTTTTSMSSFSVSDASMETLSERRRYLKARLQHLHVELAGTPMPQSMLGRQYPSTPIPVGLLPSAGGVSSPIQSPTQASDASSTASTPSSPSSPSKGGGVSSPPPSSPTRDNFARIATNVTNMLKASGKRLSLTGRWWSHDDEEEDDEGTTDENLPSSKTTKKKNSQGARKDRDSHDCCKNLETLTRHYCTSVEVLVDRKQKEVVELESLCALWEKGNTPDGNV